MTSSRYVLVVALKLVVYGIAITGLVLSILRSRDQTLERGLCQPLERELELL
jgi:hypothetical protein